MWRHRQRRWETLAWMAQGCKRIHVQFPLNAYNLRGQLLFSFSFSFVKMVVPCGEKAIFYNVLLWFACYTNNWVLDAKIKKYYVHRHVIFRQKFKYWIINRCCRWNIRENEILYCLGPKRLVLKSLSFLNSIF